MLQVFSMLLDQGWSEGSEDFSKSRNQFRPDEVFDWLLLLLFRVNVYLKLSRCQMFSSVVPWIQHGNIQRTPRALCHMRIQEL